MKAKVSYKTKKEISTALEELVLKKSLSKITVTEIMQHCGKSRQTFYRNFSDIDDLIYWKFKIDVEYFSELFYENMDFEQSILGTALTMKKQEIFYRDAVNTDGPNSFQAQFFHSMIEYSFEHIGRRNLNDQLIFIVKFYWYGAAQSIVEWVKQGMIISPKEFSKLLFCSMPEPLKKYYHIEKEDWKILVN